MKGKNLFVAAIACATLLLGFSGTSSAAEFSTDLSTLQVESQELAYVRRDPRRMQPPPPPPRVVRRTETRVVRQTERRVVRRTTPKPVRSNRTGISISIRI